MVDAVAVERAGRTITFLAVGAFLMLTTKSALGPMREHEARVVALSDAIGLLSTAEAGMERLNAQIERVRTAIDASASVLPSSPEIELFLGRLGFLAQRTSVEIEALTPGEVLPRDLYQELHLRVRVSGAFTDVQRFIHELERSERLARIEKVELVGTAPGEPCAGQMSLALFFSPLDAGAG